MKFLRFKNPFPCFARSYNPRNIFPVGKAADAENSAVHGRHFFKGSTSTAYLIRTHFAKIITPLYNCNLGLGIFCKLRYNRFHMCGEVCVISMTRKFLNTKQVVWS